MTTTEQLPGAVYPTINPYRHGLRLIWERLRWDLTPESYRSRAKLRAWRDRFKGEKAVIVCNGPSLLKNDLSLLDGFFSFGLNKINLLFETSSFRPSCVVAVNKLVIEQNQAFFNETELPLFLDGPALRWVNPRANIAYLHCSGQPRMARDCSISVQQGGTVTFVALQLAFHMGFRDVALIGCDHNFAQKGPAHLRVVSGTKDESHFDPRYFSGGMPWNLPDLAASEYFYSMAGETFQQAGGRVVNCTEGGKLELFERRALAEWTGSRAR